MAMRVPFFTADIDKHIGGIPLISDVVIDNRDFVFAYGDLSRAQESHSSYWSMEVA